MRPRSLVTLALAIVAFAAGVGCGGGSGSPDGVVQRPVADARGSLTGCPEKALSGFRCGEIEVPLERAAPRLGKIGIGFAVRPPTDRSRPSLGTIFAAEGGPGYSSTGSAADYVATFDGLLKRRRLVLVDQRGTGMSGALRCRGSQAARVNDQITLARCARKLARRFDSYRTAAAADDIDDVRRALRIGAISLYGDSYGTFLAQSYAYRHGDNLRALVLDSAYPTQGESPWYPSGPRAGIRNLNLECRRSPKCSGDARGRLRRATALLRRSGRSAVPLAELIWDAGYKAQAYLKVDNAVSGLLRGDAALYDRLTAVVPGGYGPVREYSHALEMIVSCNDYPMLWKKTSSVKQRRGQLKRAVRDYPRQRFAPFTPSEIVHSIFLDYLYCLTAPPPGPRYEPPAGDDPDPTDAPVLVINGEIDDTTTPIEGRYVVADFPNARQFIAPNAGHVDALYYPKRAAAREIRAFLRANN